MQNWLRSGWLTEHATSRQEIANLFGVADRDLQACRTAGLVADWRFSIAYNAALQVASAARAAAGYKAARSGHHYHVIQSLALTLGTDAVMLNNLDTVRKKRNVADYERAGAISDTEAGEMLAMAEQLRKDIETWIAKNHPELKP